MKKILPLVLLALSLAVTPLLLSLSTFYPALVYAQHAPPAEELVPVEQEPVVPGPGGEIRLGPRNSFPLDGDIFLDHANGVPYGPAPGDLLISDKETGEIIGWISRGGDPNCRGGCFSDIPRVDDGDDGDGDGDDDGDDITPAPAPTCTIDLVPASSTVIIESNTPLVASFSASSGTINEVHFSSSDTGNVTVSPASDSDSPYGTTASGASLGSATITATVHMTTTGHDHETACSDTATVEVTNPPGWWQTKDADVWSRGDLVSNIPSTYDGNECDGRWFSCTGAGGYPGVLVYNGDVNFNWGGIGSSKGWLAESGYAGPSYSYSWF
ncbi:Ig-like domain-containing protein, partial [Candidatus Microgenomates bacterium]|nr:Ig-like domain-containing protein [Candidatus Microgenomates bacterium]